MCTKEACAFRDSLKANDAYTNSAVEIVGISADPVAKNKAWVDQHGLTVRSFAVMHAEGTGTNLRICSFAVHCPLRYNEESAERVPRREWIAWLDRRLVILYMVFR